MTKIKICGLKRPEDIEMINKYRPDYCGFIINFPKSHRSLSPEQVRSLAAGVDREYIKTVGVFVDEPIENVAALLNDGTLDMAQLHGSESEGYIEILKKQTDKKIIKAFAVKDCRTLEAAAKSSADYILLDQGQGSGQSFDWSILGSESAKEISGPDGFPERDWFLAGGLNCGNIAEAIRRFHPFAVDLSSAVETDKFKDERKVCDIISLVRNTD